MEELGNVFGAGGPVLPDVRCLSPGGSSGTHEGIVSGHGLVEDHGEAPEIAVNAPHVLAEPYNGFVLCFYKD